MNKTLEARKPAPDLTRLQEVELAPAYRQIYQQVAAACAGPEPWRRKKLLTTYELLALSQISTRLVVQYVDASAAFRAVFLMTVPVPCRRGGQGPLVVESVAQIALTYRAEAMVTPQSGFSFLEILQPRHVFHPNVSPSHLPPGAQVLCLGAKIPAGIKLVELILMAYTGISLQTVQFSLSDPAGVRSEERRVGKECRFRW